MDEDDIDKVIEQMELDELSDAPLLSPRDFAKLIGVAPQLVYYYLRNGRLEYVICNCGRKCIDVASSKEFFENRGKS